MYQAYNMKSPESNHIPLKLVSFCFNGTCLDNLMTLLTILHKFLSYGTCIGNLMSLLTVLGKCYPNSTRLSIYALTSSIRQLCPNSTRLGIVMPLLVVLCRFSP